MLNDFCFTVCLEKVHHILSKKSFWLMITVTTVSHFFVKLFTVCVVLKCFPLMCVTAFS